MNWTFILQISITILVFYLANWFYRRSAWLHYDGFIEIDRKKHHPIILFFINQFNKEGVFLYLLVVLFVLPLGLGGLFICILFIKGAYKEFERFLYSLNWWEQSLTIACLIFLYFGVRILWDTIKKNIPLMPKYNKDSQSWINHNIREIDTYKIQTYPRLTIYDLTESEEKCGKVIFDSISFLKSNKLMNVYDNSFKTSLSIGKKININNVAYSILNLDVIFFSTFQYIIHSTDHKKISENDAPNVPYNIQIVIELRRI